MKDAIVAIFYFCDEYLKFLNRPKGWFNEKMSDSEVMTVIIVASMFFYGNIERARVFLKEHGYIPNMLSKSRLNRRLHAIEDEIWYEFIGFVKANVITQSGVEDYIVDSFPVAVCRNIRIGRCKILQGEAFRGYCASKKEYFYGFKVSVITNLAGIPYKMIIAPGSEHDLPAIKVLDPQILPEGSTLYGDAAYNDYEYEDYLEKRNIRFAVDRKLNTKRPYRLEDYVNLRAHRKTVEMTFNAITREMARKIHAVLSKGIELKILGFVIATTIKLVINL